MTSAAEAHALINLGRCCQRVGATRLNEASSRSHAILSLRALRCHRLSKTSGRSSASATALAVAGCGSGSSSVLSFCDLAGSERCVKAATLAQAQRLREANSINTSLLALARCIDALRYNSTTSAGSCNPRVVPYRESKLTRLFQNFFGATGGSGGGRACLLVNATPSASLAEETLHALRFSALASQVLIPPASVPVPPPAPPIPAPSKKSQSHLQSPISPSSAAAAVIQGRLREHLLQRGFHLR